MGLWVALGACGVLIAGALLLIANARRVFTWVERVTRPEAR